MNSTTVETTKKRLTLNLGRDNLAVTLFVPYDCPNNCPFCTSKKDYADTSNFSLQKILFSLGQMSSLKYVRDIVITGGEPFANIQQLKIILQYIKSSIPGKSVYINTTLPIKTKADKDNIIALVKQFKDVITGLNVSRHMLLKTKLEDDSILPILRKETRIRINSVLMDFEKEKKTIDEFIEKYSHLANEISFRADYRHILTLDDLKGFNDKFLLELMNKKKLHYISSGGCHVCNDDLFELKVNNKTENLDVIKPFIIHYHRGMEHSLFKVNETTYLINDIIIKQDGSVNVDWDNTVIPPYILLKQWPIEKVKGDFTKTMRDLASVRVNTPSKSSRKQGIGIPGMPPLDDPFLSFLFGGGPFGMGPGDTDNDDGEEEYDDYDSYSDDSYGSSCGRSNRRNRGCGGYYGGCGGGRCGG